MRRRAPKPLVEATGEEIREAFKKFEEGLSVFSEATRAYKHSNGPCAEALAIVAPNRARYDLFQDMTGNLVRRRIIEYLFDYENLTSMELQLELADDGIKCTQPTFLTNVNELVKHGFVDELPHTKDKQKVYRQADDPYVRLYQHVVFGLFRV